MLSVKDKLRSSWTHVKLNTDLFCFCQSFWCLEEEKRTQQKKRTIAFIYVTVYPYLQENELCTYPIPVFICYNMARRKSLILFSWNFLHTTRMANRNLFLYIWKWEDYVKLVNLICLWQLILAPTHSAQINSNFYI